MYWLTIPLMGIHIGIICGVVALRAKWSNLTLGILIFNLVAWAYLLNCLLDDVSMGRH